MASSVPQAVTLVSNQLAEAAATVRAVKGRVQAVRRRGWGMSPLVANERTRAFKGLVANKADKKGITQVGLNKVLWMLPLHVPFFELLIREGDQAVETLIGTQTVWSIKEMERESQTGLDRIYHFLYSIFLQRQG